MRMVVVLLVLVACGPRPRPGAGHHEPPPPAEQADCASCPGPRMGMPSWQCVDGRRGGPACKQLGDGTCGWVVVDCERAQPGGACQADAEHCCQPSGVIVKPGGCQPSYPAGVQPATEREPDGTCKPIPCTLKCLPPGARIATPQGEVEVSRLKVGDVVWTMGARGQRIAAPIRQMSTVHTGPEHTLLEITLADGRVVRASRGHPGPSGEPLGSTETLDGAAITSVREVPWGNALTWDLLPEGPTGTYWADGVLLGSTLATPRSSAARRP